MRVDSSGPPGRVGLLCFRAPRDLRGCPAFSAVSWLAYIVFILGKSRFNSGSDPENDALTFSVTGTEASRFEAVQQNGVWVLALKAGVSLDYEQGSSINVTVQASDGSLTYDEVMAITIDATYNNIYGTNERRSFVWGSDIGVFEGLQGELALSVQGNSGGPDGYFIRGDLNGDRNADIRIDVSSNQDFTFEEFAGLLIL